MSVSNSIDPGTDPTKINREYINLPQVVNILCNPHEKQGQQNL